MMCGIEYSWMASWCAEIPLNPGCWGASGWVGRLFPLGSIWLTTMTHTVLV